MEVETKETAVLTLLAFTAGTFRDRFGTEKVNGLLLRSRSSEKGPGQGRNYGKRGFFTVLLSLNTLKGH